MSRRDQRKPFLLLRLSRFPVWQKLFLRQPQLILIARQEKERSCRCMPRLMINRDAHHALFLLLIRIRPLYPADPRHCLKAVRLLRL